MRKFALYAVLTVVLLGVAALMVAGAYFEPRMVFTPSQAYSSWTRKGYEAVEQGRTRALVQDVWLTTADGVRIHAWFMSPRGDRGRELPVVLWFHGNAGNVGRFLRVYEKVVGLSAHVFAVDYRGYGHSEGTPSEEGVYRDADAAWDYLTRQQGIPPERIIIYGFSLGGAVAVDLAARVKPGGLIVQSSFTSIPELAHNHYPMVPRWLVRTQLDSLAKISEVRCPKLFIHSTGDRLIPYDMARRLYDAAPEPKEFLVVKGAGHSQTFSKGGKKLLKAIRRLLRTIQRQSANRPIGGQVRHGVTRRVSTIRRTPGRRRVAKVLRM